MKFYTGGLCLYVVTSFSRQMAVCRKELGNNSIHDILSNWRSQLFKWSTHKLATLEEGQYRIRLRPASFRIGKYM